MRYHARSSKASTHDKHASVVDSAVSPRKQSQLHKRPVTISLRIPLHPLRSIRLKLATLTDTKLWKYVQHHVPFGAIKRYGIRWEWLAMAVLMLSTLFIEMYSVQNQTAAYALTAKAQTLVPAARQEYSQLLKQDVKTGNFEYNQSYRPNGGSSVSSNAGYSASFARDPSKGVTVTDVINSVSFTMKPTYRLAEPKQDNNRLIYPVVGSDIQQVYTAQSIRVKEDIVLNTFAGDTKTFSYDLVLSSGTEARLEKNGSIGVYGVNPALLGSVTTSTDSDAKLLENARNNGKKTNLLFTIPAPIIKESSKKPSKASVQYRLEGTKLQVVADNLKQASYPLSIDPSVYIETAAKLMRGNNETNTDFDIDNELIQKSQTTGARIDNWTSTSDLNTGMYGQGTAVAGGYIYSAGGTSATGSAKWTRYTAGTATFTVPANVDRLIVKAWGAGGGGGTGTTGTTNANGGDGGGGGYASATINVTAGESLNVRVGTGGTAGANNSSDGGNGGGYTALLRSTTFLVQAGGGGGGGGTRVTAGGGAGGAGGGSSGLAALGGSPTGAGGGSGGTSAAGGTGGSLGTGGVAGATGAANAGGDGGGSRTNCSTSVAGRTGNAGGTGGGGLRGSLGSCQGGGGGGGGRFGGGGGGSTSSGGTRAGGGGGGGSSLVTGTNTVEKAGSGKIPGNSGDVDRNGAGNGGTGSISAATAGAAGGIVIMYTTTTSYTNAVTTVQWAKFNASTKAIESPNPGAGACTGWCTSSSYALPAARKNLSLLAYNGYLYALGGENSSGTPQTTVYIAKLGANGEPQLWHPTDSVQSHWTFWYTDTSLTAARSQFGAVAYNNKIYILGGLTTSSTLVSSDTVQAASISPNGTLSAFSSTNMTGLGTSRYGLSAQVYNDTIYVIGGDNTYTGTPVATVEYAKISSTGAIGAWTATSSLTSGRMTGGGSYATIFGGYIYVGGGCTGFTSGYCSSIATDVQLASINADGSLAPWNAILNLESARMGYTMIGWQGGLYRLGGCEGFNTSTGTCAFADYNVDYGVINVEGEASTVATSSPNGTAPCSGGSAYSCDLPGTSIVGNVLNETAILNGYLYIMGGCTTEDCSTVSQGVTYQAIGSDGSLTKPSSCGTWSTTYSYCYNSTSLTRAIAAGGIAVFGGYIYIVGGFPESGGNSYIYYASPNTDGSITSWSAGTDMSTIGATDVAFPYAYARANPASASSTPGNLYIFGGCTGTLDVGCGGYTSAVYKCDLSTAGVPSGCDNSAQMAITAATDPNNGNASCGTGLGAAAGAVYANYIYLMGGLTTSCTDLTTLRYAKFDNSNNVVAVSGGVWIQSTSETDFGRRRGAGFGYNGYLYVVGGYDGTTGGGVLADIEFAKINVSDGSVGAFTVSTVNINQRWGLSLAVSNSYAYVVGGCVNGQSPGNCNRRTDSIQTFQIYNNDSGAVNSYTAGNTLGTDLIGGSSTIYNGYIYYAGGCTNIGCTTLSSSTYYASVDAYGIVGSWTSTGGAMPAARAWGKLVSAGTTLYYIGGQTGAAATTAQSTVFYTDSINSSTGAPTWNASTSGATKGIGDTGGGGQARTQFGAVVWNNRIYVLGGYNASGTVQSTVYVSPTISSGNISSNWSSGSTSFNVARAGLAAVAYANNLYILGGYDGTNYLSDVQYSQINSGTGNAGSWTYSTRLPSAIRDAEAFAANGYIYLVGGRTAASTCTPSTVIAPISANTTIATGNNPTGVGDWFETNVRYTGDRYGAALAYKNGRMYLIGGGCSSFVAAGDRMYYSTIKSQPQIAKYSRLIDTDTNVFPTKWLLNGLDNSIGARWQASYQSMYDASNVVLHSTMDQGTNGNPVTETNTAFDNCYAQGSGSTAYDNSTYVTPYLSAKFSSPGGTSGSGACLDTMTTSGVRYDRFYVRFTSNPSSNTTIYTADNLAAGNETIAGLRITTTGTLQVRDKTTAEGSELTLDSSAWNRIETFIDRPNQIFTVKVFRGANLHSSTPSSSSTITLNRSTATDFDQMTVGMVSSLTTAWNVWIDDVKSSYNYYPGSAFPQWGSTTNFGDVTLGTPNTFTPLDESGSNTSYARWYYFMLTIDASQTFGYPEDVTRGPTVADMSLFFTSDPSKRLLHGKTFTGGEQQPLDTPF